MLEDLGKWGSCTRQAKFESYLHKGQDGIQIFLRALIMFTGKHWTQQITYDTCIMAVLTAMIQYSNCDRMRDKKKLTSHTMPETLIAQF